MKVRTGFVSNSSSSSFCIIGQQVDNDKPLVVDKRIKYMIQSDTDEFCGDSGAILIWVDSKFAEWLNSEESEGAKAIMQWDDCKIYKIIVSDERDCALTADDVDKLAKAVREAPTYIKSGECDQHSINSPEELAELLENR